MTMPDGTLPTFPVDPMTLDMLEAACNSAWKVDETGNMVLAEGEFGFQQFLEFMAGGRQDWAVGETENPDVDIYGRQSYSEVCVIKALISEVRKLRDQKHGRGGGGV